MHQEEVRIHGAFLQQRGLFQVAHLVRVHLFKKHLQQQVRAQSRLQAEDKADLVPSIFYRHHQGFRTTLKQTGRMVLLQLHMEPSQRFLGRHLEQIELITLVLHQQMKRGTDPSQPIFRVLYKSLLWSEQHTGAVE
jgi:hypothetical protein